MPPGRRIRPRGYLAIWRALEEAHQALGRDLMRQRRQERQRKGPLDIMWTRSEARCADCGTHLSIVVVAECMVDPELHCLRCAGHWPDLIVDWGTIEATG